VEEFRIQVSPSKRKKNSKGAPKPAAPAKKQEKKRHAPSKAKEMVSSGDEMGTDSDSSPTRPPKKAKKAVTKPAAKKLAAVEQATAAESHL
jgi:hypothetical protein